MIDITRLFQDYRIMFETAGHKHVSRGWIGIPCPFCSGNPGYHLGYCIDEGNRYAGSFVCWRCGGKNSVKVLSSVLSVTESEARRIVAQYSSGKIPTKPTEKRKPRRVNTECHWPAGTSGLKPIHKRYLRERGFSPKKLERVWGIRGTGPAGPYRHRIIIPVFFRGELVSYQGRDITGRSSAKYKACPQDLEKRDHNHCLYGEDLVTGESIVVCEGVTDVWRLGPGAVATFGIKYTLEQLRLLSRYKRVFVLYDTDGVENAESAESAELMAESLTAVGTQCEIITLDSGDPAELSPREARELMSDLIG